MIEKQAGMTLEYSRTCLKVILVLKQPSEVFFGLQNSFFNFSTAYFGPQLLTLPSQSLKLDLHVHTWWSHHISWTSTSIIEPEKFLAGAQGAAPPAGGKHRAQGQQ